VTAVNELMVILLQLIPFANTAAFFCALLGLVLRSFLRRGQRWRNYHVVYCFETIIRLHDSWLVFRNHSLQTGFSCL